MVVNSRLQRRHNHIWRRRKCLSCFSLFTTLEQTEISKAFMVKGYKSKLAPFDRDRLFIDIYSSCKHRPSAIGDAAALTQTVVSQILEKHNEGAVQRQDIVIATCNALKRFDRTAAAVYEAYHPV